MSKDFAKFKNGKLCIYVGSSEGYLALTRALKEMGIKDPAFPICATEYDLNFPYFFMDYGELNAYTSVDDIKELANSNIEFQDWQGVDFIECDVTKRAEVVLEELDPVVATEIYILQRMQRVAADVLTRAEDCDITLTESEAKGISSKYVRMCRYDCNLSYWDNLDILIQEQIAERD